MTTFSKAPGMIGAASAVLLVTTLAAGCRADSPAADVTVRDGSRPENVLRHIRVDGDRVVVSLPDGRKAAISATGELAVGSANVPLDDRQRALARRYYEEAASVRSEGAAMGKAGAKMAGTAVSAVIASLARGEPGAIGDRIEAEAAVLERQALGLCHRVAALQSVQLELAEAVPAFTPYPAVARVDASDCG
jgi:hypothetical protein